jgi:predicted NUDIX family phosphoesterase
MSDEMILCHGAPILDRSYPEPFTPWSPAVADEFGKILRGSWYHPRSLAESNVDMKQIIPYVLVRAPMGRGVIYAVHERAGSEGRLTGRLSIGVGGHLTWDDQAHVGLPGFGMGMHREMREELGDVPPCKGMEFLGVINDRSDAVGRVHLGIAIRFDADYFTLPLPRPGEADRWVWLAPAMIRHMPPGVLESWSRVLVDGGLIDESA